MKNILTIALALMVINCRAQKIFEKNDWVVYASQFISGAATGIREEVLYHPDNLLSVVGYSHRQWWDNRVSYHNKEHMATAFVAFSDANHFFKAATLVTDCISVGFSFGDVPKKNKVVWIAKKILFAYISNKIGFCTSYYGVFGNRF